MTQDVYRIAVYEALRPFLYSQRDRPGLEVAEVSGRALLEEFGFGQGTYLAPPRFDLMDPPTWTQWAGQFDLVLCDFVLEHVPVPFLAIEALRSILRPGGHAIVTTAFLFPIHDDGPGQSGDFFRFSPRALRSLFPTEDAEGWTDVDVRSWGNRAMAAKVLDWSANNRDPELADQAQVNEPDVPIIVWAVARKR